MPQEQDIQLIANILKKIPLFEELDANQHQEIIQRITLQYFPAGHIIFHENDPGDAMYIVKKGVVRIYHEAETPSLEKDVSMLGDNDFFGEMALIEEKGRNATAKVMEESEIFKLSKADFNTLISQNAGMAEKISTEFLKRLKTNLRESS